MKLNDWLAELETRHPKAIDLGLERIAAVAKNLSLGSLAKQVITVAGTNGKGSCVAALYSLLLSANLRVAAYTSPHLVHFNERISINGQLATDQDLCLAFERIEEAREAISLSYFEFTTLAAFLLMEQTNLDIAILEVGLGGRLDAVNLIDADIAVVTSIALDHQEWLGTDVVQIAREKLAVGRANKPMVFGEAPEEVDVREICAENNLCLSYMGEDFRLTDDGQFFSRQAPATMDDRPAKSLVLKNQRLDWQQLPKTSVACALEALQHLTSLNNHELDYSSLAKPFIQGRFQVVQYLGKTIVLDVAHNPAAATLLAQRLREQYPEGNVTVIFAAMADKDIPGIINPLKDCAQQWLLPGLNDVARAAKPTEILPLLYNAQPVESVAIALDRAIADQGVKTLLVCGSFITVGAALEWCNARGITF